MTQEYNTDERIAAAVILKGDVELVRYYTGDVVNLPENLNTVVQELTGAYKVALAGVKGL